MPASTDDLLTALKQVVIALNAQTTNATILAGTQDFFNVTSATYVKSGAGRIVNAIAVVLGSADGTVYDASSVTDKSRPLCPVIHTTAGRQIINMPFQYGLLVVPGSGQTITGSYS